MPADNPFGAGNPVWATGFRNPYGLAFGGAGRAFVTVNGPTGDLGIGGRGHDLAFEPVAGGRYQWPACYGYSHPTPGAATCLGRPEPDWSSEAETLVPTGAAWVDASGPAPYAERFVFCTYARASRVFTPGSPHATVANGPAECRLDVQQGTGSRALLLRRGRDPPPLAVRWLRNRDLDGAVVAAVGVLDVDPGATLVRRVEVEAGELGARQCRSTPSGRCLRRRRSGRRRSFRSLANQMSSSTPPLRSSTM